LYASSLQTEMPECRFGRRIPNFWQSVKNIFYEAAARLEFSLKAEEN
jgi:hypothetical protein